MSDAEDEPRKEFERDPIAAYRRGYAKTLEAIGLYGWTQEHIHLVMTYGCRDEPRPAHPAPPGLIENAPEGYWDARGGPPEIVDGMLPATPGGCGFKRLVYLGVGVEGPKVLKADKTYIPAPFVAGKCPECGLSLSHVDWQRDAAIDPQPFPPEDLAVLPWFRVPSPEKAEELAAMGYGGAELVEPTQEALDRHAYGGILARGARAMCGLDVVIVVENPDRPGMALHLAGRVAETRDSKVRFAESDDWIDLWNAERVEFAGGLKEQRLR